MADLFQRGGLENDTGLLRERWQQEGSELITGTISHNGAAGDETILTVTAGKVFYCKQIFVANEDASNPEVLTIKDNTTAKITISTQASSGQEVNLDSPIKFSTSVFLNGPAGVYSVTVAGWEEET